MSRSRRGETRKTGMSLSMRFSLAMSAALAVVMAATGFFLFQTTTNVVERSVEGALMGASRAEAERGKLDNPADYYRQPNEATRVPVDPWKIADVTIQEGAYEGQPARAYRYADGETVVVPNLAKGRPEGSLYGLFFAVTGIVVLVGAWVAFLIASQVTKPIDVLVDDVRKIARGNLAHRTRVREGGEVGHLARVIDAMAQSLEEAQDAEIELGVREREREVALEVREALLPESTPTMSGYELADEHVAAAEPGGDFHDYVQLSDGRVILIVCDVSGTGVPGALVGATARGYLKGELERGGVLSEALKEVNRKFAKDVRRGMFVTTLCVLVDPEAHVMTVACAGHKVPLIRFDAAEGQLKLVQPGGIALGFDAGPVFDRSLEVVRVPLGAGDRVVLANTGPVKVIDPDGEEIGEKAFYRLVARTAKLPAAKVIDRILEGLEEHADEEPFPSDISLVALGRNA